MQWTRRVLHLHFTHRYSLFFPSFPLISFPSSPLLFILLFIPLFSFPSTSLLCSLVVVWYGTVQVAIFMGRTKGDLSDTPKHMRHSMVRTPWYDKSNGVQLTDSQQCRLRLTAPLTPILFPVCVWCDLGTGSDGHSGSASAQAVDCHGLVRGSQWEGERGVSWEISHPDAYHLE